MLTWRRLGHRNQIAAAMAAARPRHGAVRRPSIAQIPHKHPQHPLRHRPAAHGFAGVPVALLPAPAATLSTVPGRSRRGSIRRKCPAFGHHCPAPAPVAAAVSIACPVLPDGGSDHAIDCPVIGFVCPAIGIGGAAIRIGAPVIETGGSDHEIDCPDHGICCPAIGFFCPVIGIGGSVY